MGGLGTEWNIGIQMKSKGKFLGLLIIPVKAT